MVIQTRYIQCGTQTWWYRHVTYSVGHRHGGIDMLHTVWDADMVV